MTLSPIGHRSLPPVSPGHFVPKGVQARKGTDALMFGLITKICIEMPDKIFTWMLQHLCKTYPGSTTGLVLPLTMSHWSSCSDQFGGASTPEHLKRYLDTKAVVATMQVLLETILLSQPDDIVRFLIEHISTSQQLRTEAATPAPRGFIPVAPRDGKFRAKLSRGPEGGYAFGQNPVGVEEVVTVGLSHGVELGVFTQYGPYVEKPPEPVVVPAAEKPAPSKPSAPAAPSSSSNDVDYIMQLSHGVQLSIPEGATLPGSAIPSSSPGDVAYVMQLSHGVQLRVWS